MRFRKMFQPVFRIVQFLTLVHKIHHIHHSYGYKLPFVNIGIFRKLHHGVKLDNSDTYYHKLKFKIVSIKDNLYHNCTLTGTY